MDDSLKLEKLLNILFVLDKRYKIEKIISFNNKNYLNELRVILNNPNLELHNHHIDCDEGYIHITFEKELCKDDNTLIYDSFCPYAISLKI